MKNLFAGFVALLAATFSTVAVAGVPSHVTVRVATIGRLNNTNNTAPMTYNGKVMTVTMSGCEVRWNDGTPFYVLTAEGNNTVLVIRKDLMDYAYAQTNQDWDTAIEALAGADKICKVTG
jgi:hypothetical protein